MPVFKMIRNFILFGLFFDYSTNLHVRPQLTTRRCNPRIFVTHLLRHVASRFPWRHVNFRTFTVSTKRFSTAATLNSYMWKTFLVFLLKLKQHVLKCFILLCFLLLKTCSTKCYAMWCRPRWRWRRQAAAAAATTTTITTAVFTITVLDFNWLRQNVGNPTYNSIHCTSGSPIPTLSLKLS